MTMREQKCSQICEQMFTFSELIFFRDAIKYTVYHQYKKNIEKTVVVPYNSVR